MLRCAAVALVIDYLPDDVASTQILASLPSMVVAEVNSLTIKYA